MGITILPPRRFWFLILFSFCLPTVQLHFTPILNFKQSTQAKKKKKICLQSFPIHYICTFLFYFFVNNTHTHTQRAPWDVINFLLLWSSALLSVLVLIILLLSFSVQFLFREVLLPHCRFKGYNAIKYLNKYLIKYLITRVVEVPWLHGRHFEKLQSSRAGLSCR